jgi:hypothetical protein
MNAKTLEEAHALLLRVCDMDDGPGMFGFNFEFQGWEWRLPEDEAWSFYGLDFIAAVNSLAARFNLATT